MTMSLDPTQVLDNAARIFWGTDGKMDDDSHRRVLGLLQTHAELTGQTEADSAFDLMFHPYNSTHAEPSK